MDLLTIIKNPYYIKVDYNLLGGSFLFILFILINFIILLFISVFKVKVERQEIYGPYLTGKSYYEYINQCEGGMIDKLYVYLPSDRSANVCNSTSAQ